VPQEICYACRHFSGGLIGKRYGKNVFRTHMIVPDEIRDAVGQGFCFTASGAGKNKHRPVACGYRVALLRVK
jgi:hypothetical protein